jgi:hypothetical protein
MDMHPEVAKAVPGVLGSLSAVLLMRADWKTGAAIVLPGSALAYYGGTWVGNLVGMPDTLAGYLVGLGGMAFMAKVIETWQKFNLGRILNDTLRKWLGLPPESEGGQ